MVRLKQLPMSSPACVWFAYHGDRYGCDCPSNSTRRCTPAYEHADLSSCDLKHEGGIAFRNVNRASKPKDHFSSGDCVHLGEPLRDADGMRLTVECKTCQQQMGRPNKRVLYACSIHGKCTKDGHANGIASCAGCKDKSFTLTPLKEMVIDPPRSDKRETFNASLFRRANGRMYLAYRTGQGGSNIFVCPMSNDLTPGGSVRLDLRHKLCASSREDPRLFEHNGKLHCMFVGVVGDPANGKPGSTHVLVARLNDDLTVEKTWHPQYELANHVWEKSHGYFSWHGELFCVYSISPHVVLHMAGDEALPFSRHTMSMPWTGGHLRGGASPILVGDEYWSWFHGSVDKGATTPFGTASTRVYNIGVYCFEAKPPFRPTRITPNPVMWADEKTMKPAWCAVSFPCGSVLDGDTWKVSMGRHDREVVVCEWRHKDIERLLVKI